MKDDLSRRDSPKFRALLICSPTVNDLWSHICEQPRRFHPFQIPRLLPSRDFNPRHILNALRIIQANCLESDMTSRPCLTVLAHHYKPRVSRPNSASNSGSFSEPLGKARKDLSMPFSKSSVVYTSCSGILNLMMSSASCIAPKVVMRAMRDLLQ